MKLPVLLLAGTLAANAALLAVYLRRPASAADSAPRSAVTSAASTKTNTAAPKSAAAATTATPTSEGIDPKAWSTLESTDLKTLALRLRAAGFPTSVVNAVIRARISETIRPRMQALIASAPETPFWTTDRNINVAFNGQTDPKTLAAIRDLNRESSELFKAAVGIDTLAAEMTANPYAQRRYGNIPSEKIDQLQRIETDYNELRNEVNNSTKGIMLPEDREKIALLEKEKRADLAKVLSPEQLDDFLVRGSMTTTRLRAALTSMNATEEEFRAIYQAQVGFDDKYLNYNVGITYSNADTMRDRQADQAKVAEQIKLALGEQRFAEYTRSSDREFQTISRIAQQANLPTTAAIQAYDLRDNVSKESNRIFADTTLNNDQKRTALQTLAQNTRTQLTSTLGDSGARSYLQTATWLTRVENGAAVTFNPGGGTSTRSLPPPPRPGAPAGAAPTTTTAPSGFFIGN